MKNLRDKYAQVSGGHFQSTILKGNRKKSFGNGRSVLYNTPHYFIDIDYLFVSYEANARPANVSCCDLRASLISFRSPFHNLNKRQSSREHAGRPTFL